MDSIPRTSGIYKITCTTTKKIYIGSAINLYARKVWHWSALRHNRHGNTKLQRAWNKYEEASFVFEVLELVLAPFLLEREQYYFQKLRPFDRGKGYNILAVAGSAYGYKHSDDARKKMSEAGKRRVAENPMSLEQRAALSKKMKGRVFTEEWRRKIGQAQLGNKKGLGKSHPGISHSTGTYRVFTPDGQEMIVKNLARFCKDNGLVNSRMRCVMRGEQDNHKGWRVKKIG